MKRGLNKFVGILLLIMMCALLMGTSWMKPNPRQVDRAWLLKERETILDALNPPEIDFHLRAFYMDRSFERSPYQQTLALGGWFKYRTRWWNHLSVGLTPYVTMPLAFDDADRGGTGVLPQNQEGYAVLGEAYLQLRLGNTLGRVYRQELHTPWINTYDFRLVPVTYEALSVQNKDLPHTTITAAYVTGIKGWTNTSFQSMSEAAGFSGTDEPVILAGGVFAPGEDLTVQLWDFWAQEYMNTMYMEAKYSWHLGHDLKLTPALQFTKQQDVGDAIGGSFNTYAWGAQAALDWRGATFYLVYTSVDDAFPIQQPWANYQGFTAMVEQNNFQAGMDTWMVALDWKLDEWGLKGLQLSGYYSDARSPNTGAYASPDQTETDIILRYRFPGALKDFRLTAKYAYVAQQEILDGQDFQDIRLILNWQFAWLN